MKIYCIDIDGSLSAGVLLDDNHLYVIDGTIRQRVIHGEPVLSALSAGDELSQKVKTAAVDFKNSPGAMLRQKSVIPLDRVEILRPVINPSKVVAVGLNYMDHCIEQNIPPPENPILFTKFPSSLCNPGDGISWDPGLTNQVDYEAELAVVIGKRAYRVSRADALDYVAGYTCLNDLSARDLQFSDGQWIRGKSIDSFCPVGPCLVTREEVPDPQRLGIRCTVNGTVLQDSSTDKMIFTVAELIEFISRGITLYPGDIIATGTPQGVGVFREPKIFLHPGDTVEVHIEKIGILRNKIEKFAFHDKD
jgi:2-keto-4-pentenoate hydratase/2-oxohepta-3-ene-1,7-dioic acid hydratase in catechol pathway